MFFIKHSRLVLCCSHPNWSKWCHFHRLLSSEEPFWAFYICRHRTETLSRLQFSNHCTPLCANQWPLSFKLFASYLHMPSSVLKVEGKNQTKQNILTWIPNCLLVFWPAWTRSSTAYCRWPCFGRRVGLDDPQRSLPTPTILWFCDSVPYTRNAFWFRTKEYIFHPVTDFQNSGAVHIYNLHNFCIYCWVSLVSVIGLNRDPTCSKASSVWVWPWNCF